MSPRLYAYRNPLLYGHYVEWKRMCGITLLLERATATRSLLEDDRLAHDIEKRLRQRGPDHFGVVDRTLGDTGASQWRLQLCSAVLHLRGNALTPQPREDVDGNVLCWNGEVFGYHDAQGHIVDIEHGNDTQWLSDLLIQWSRTDDSMASIVAALRRVHGPFAFVWFHAATQRVVFGHDRFGRRSLLVHCDASELLVSMAASADKDCVAVDFSNLSQLVLSSVALQDENDVPMEFAEVPANGVFVLDLVTQQLEFHPYDSIPSPQTDSVDPVAVVDRYHCGLPQASPLDQAAYGLLTVLSNAVGVRVRTIPRHTDSSTHVGVLFSGGLDSVVLAALAHYHVVDPNEPIDLLNVCFDSGSQFQSPDRLAALISYRELRVLFPTRHWRFVCVNEEYEHVVSCQDELLSLLRPCDTHMDFNIGAAFWCLSRCHGFITQDQDFVNDQRTAVDLNAFLTQQGVSSDQQAMETALAELRLFVSDETNPGTCPANKCKRKLKPGCPLGVCRFCCLKIHKLLGNLRQRSEVDDREQQTSRLQLVAMLPVADNAETRVDELVKVYKAHWISHEASLCRVHRSKPTQDVDMVVERTSLPSTPSITTKTLESYTTTARVLLIGIGADEQLGGYGRHKTAFVQGGEEALQHELARDMARIWKRNLGRDDRCISAHGREARFPFLDEEVVQYIASLPLTTICDFEQPRGRGDKLVLRVAATILGLNNCARLAKRAIQFGSRIAKHANIAAFGSNRQASGAAKLQGFTTADDE